MATNNAINADTSGLVRYNGTGTFDAVTTTSNNVLIGAASNGITNISPSSTSGVALISQGSSSNPTFGTVVVAGGGTGAVSLTGILTGNGTSAVTASTVTQHGILLGGASNAVSSTSVGSTGQVLQANTSADPTYSTATYPSTATGTGQILRADGTNWSATTATYPSTAGTSGNVLTSDGTNWNSTAPSGGTAKFFGSCMMTGTGSNPAASTTYYLANGQNFIFLTTSTSTLLRYYVPFACTITTVKGSIRVGGTLASNQNCTLFLRLNDTTNTNITTSLQLTSLENTFSNTGLSISCSAGDYLVFGFTSGAWTTNPTTVGFAATFSS